MSQHYDDFDEVCEEENVKQEVPEGHWKTKNGHILKMSDMDTSHVFNAIRHIENNCIRRFVAIVNFTKNKHFYEKDLEETLLETSEKYIELIDEYNSRGHKYEPWYWLKNPPKNGIDRALYREDIKNGCYAYDFHVRTRR